MNNFFLQNNVTTAKNCSMTILDLSCGSGFMTRNFLKTKRYPLLPSYKNTLFCYSAHFSFFTWELLLSLDSFFFFFFFLFFFFFIFFFFFFFFFFF